MNKTKRKFAKSPKHGNVSHGIDGLVQDCSISVANSLEILQSCTKNIDMILIGGLRHPNYKKNHSYVWFYFVLDEVTVYKIRHSTSYFCDADRHIMDYWLIVCPAPADDNQVEDVYGDEIGPRENNGVLCMSYCRKYCDQYHWKAIVSWWQLCCYCWHRRFSRDNLRCQQGRQSWHHENSTENRELLGCRLVVGACGAEG